MSPSLETLTIQHWHMESAANNKNPEASTTQANSMTVLTSKPKPHLLTLAGELRNQIIRLAVVSESPIPVVASVAFSRGKHDVRAVSPGSPSLARACKQLREEVNAIYFEENVFTFLGSAYNFNALHTFEHMAGPSASKISCVNTISRPRGDITLKLVRDATAGLSFLKSYNRLGFEFSRIQLCERGSTCCGRSSAFGVPDRLAMLSTLEAYFRLLMEDDDRMAEIRRTCYDCGGVYWDDFRTAIASVLAGGHTTKTRRHRERSFAAKQGDEMWD